MLSYVMLDDIYVVNEREISGKIGCHVEGVTNAAYRSLAFILEALLAVEYLANLSQIMLIFSKS
jgi:hypothetical protein